MHRRDFLKTAPVATAALLGASAGGLIPLAVQAAGQGVQITAAQQFAIGEMRVIALSDGYIKVEPHLLNDITPAEFEALVTAAHLDPADFRAAVNAYIVQSGDETWIVDAGTGGVFGPTLGHLPGVLGQIGIDPASVTKLIVTHLHPDHIGGAFGENGAVFPNAEMVVSKADFEFWTNKDIQAGAPDAARGMFDVAMGATAAYQDRIRLFEGEADIAPGITSYPLPGHTVGHSGLILESAGKSLLIWGDIIHVAAVQMARPEVTLAFDTDPAVAAQTRADLFGKIGGSDQLIAGMHMPFPGLGYVDRTSDGYHFVPAPWQYL